MESYLFFIDLIPLPLAPEKMNQNYRSSTKTTMTIEKGEIVLTNKKGLMEYSFTLLLPQSNLGMDVPTFSMETLRNAVETIPIVGAYVDRVTHSAKWYLDLLEDYKNSSRVFKFTVVQSIPQGRLLNSIIRDCVIDSMVIHYGESKNNVLLVDLVLAEYTPLQIDTYTALEGEKRTLISRKRPPTTWYDAKNVTPLLESSVNILKNSALKTMRSTLQSSVSSMGFHIPPLLSTGLKAVGWKAIKTSVSLACPLLGMLL